MTIENEQYYVISVHLEAEYTQISYWDRQMKEPIVLAAQTNSAPLMPNKAFWGKETRCWHYGEGAVYAREKEGGSFIEDFAGRKEETIGVAGREYLYQDILNQIVCHYLISVIDKSWNKKMLYLCFTGEYSNLLSWNWKTQMSKRLRIPKENILELTRAKSFLHYVIHQDFGISNAKAGLFDFSERGLCYYELIKDEHTDYCEVREISYQKQLGEYSYLEAGERLDEIFCGIVKEVFNKSNLSAVYLTGIGFEKNWLSKSLKILCNGKRAFIGQNLYTKGSCYYMIDQKKKQLQKPCYLKQIGRSIYTYEEFCELIFKHTALFIEEFLTEELLQWIKAELKLEQLAVRLLNMKQEKISTRMQILEIIDEKKYLTKSRLHELIRTIDYLLVQPEYRLQMYVADEYRKIGKYFAAHFLYEILLKQYLHTFESKDLANIYFHNGICLLTNMEFQKAKENILKANEYEEKRIHNQTLLLVELLLNPDGDFSEKKWIETISDEDYTSYLTQIEKISMEIDETNSLKKLYQEQKKDQLHQEIDSYRKKWKQEYRTYLQ